MFTWMIFCLGIALGHFNSEPGLSYVWVTNTIWHPCSRYRKGPYLRGQTSEQFPKALRVANPFINFLNYLKINVFLRSFMQFFVVTQPFPVVVMTAILIWTTPGSSTFIYLLPMAPMEHRSFRYFWILTVAIRTRSSRFACLQLQ